MSERTFRENSDDDAAKNDLYSFLYEQMLETDPRTSSPALGNEKSEDLAAAWSTLISKAPARWDGQSETWEEFKSAILKAAGDAGVRLYAEQFLVEAEAKKSDQVRFNYLRAYNLTKDTAAAPKDLSAYTPMLYRVSSAPPSIVLSDAGWGDNVYSAIFPTTITPTVDEIKALLRSASQQSMGSYLYRFPLGAANVAGFRYMNTAVETIKRAISAWDPDTMRLVEVISVVTPDRKQIEVSVAGNWKPITALVKK